MIAHVGHGGNGCYNYRMKSKELKTYNLPEDRVLLAAIDAKPEWMIFAFFVLGVFLIVYQRYIAGSSFFGIAICATFFLPNRVLVEFYSDFLVIFNHANKNTCEIIYYDDVVNWSYVYGITYDTLDIKLIDDSVHSIDAYSKVLFENLMNRFLKDKKEKKKKTKK